MIQFSFDTYNIDTSSQFRYIFVRFNFSLNTFFVSYISKLIKSLQPTWNYNCDGDGARYETKIFFLFTKLKTKGETLIN